MAVPTCSRVATALPLGADMRTPLLLVEAMSALSEPREGTAGWRSVVVVAVPGAENADRQPKDPHRKEARDERFDGRCPRPRKPTPEILDPIQDLVIATPRRPASGSGVP
jgi:hypothetical protein